MADVDWNEVIEISRVLHDAVGDVNREIAAGSPGRADIADMAIVLVLLNEADDLLSQARSEVHSWVAQQMEDNDQEVPGVGHLHRDWSKSRKEWESQELKRDALRAARNATAPHAVDPETGEYVHTWDQAVSALDALYNLAGYNARVSAMKKLGLSPGDYSAEGPWRPTVTITPEPGEQHE